MCCVLVSCCVCVCGWLVSVFFFSGGDILVFCQTFFKSLFKKSDRAKRVIAKKERLKTSGRKNRVIEK